MAALADLTFKKNDETTNITMTGISPSSGDGTAAVWKSQTVGSAPAHQPELRLSAREDAKGKGRALRTTYRYPQIATNTTTSLTGVVNQASFAGEWKFPKEMATADINEFVAQSINAMATTAFKSYVKSGFSAT